MANSLYSFNYFPLVSGSTTNLVFKKNTPSAWQISVIRSIRVQKEYIIRMVKSVSICAIRGRIKYSSA